MLRSIISFFLLIAIAVSVTACGTRVKRIDQPQPLFDIRKSIVTADVNIPPKIITGIQTRLDAAISATIRPVELPQVVMSVHVNSITKGLGIQQGRSEANVTVVLSDVTDGHSFQAVGFSVYSFTLDQAAADEALAEAISGRIRFLYVLMTPKIRTQIYQQPAISTRLNTDPADRPMVIPAAQVKRIGANADPILNSKTVIKDQTPLQAVVPDQPQSNAIEDGAAGKVVIQPQSGDQSNSTLETQSEVPGEGMDDGSEPCVETLETKCANAN